VLFSRDSSITVSVLCRNVRRLKAEAFRPDWSLVVLVILLVTRSCDAVVVVVMLMGKMS
jgi:hypothetical protein